MSRCPVAVRLPAFASWSSFARPGTGPPSRSAYRRRSSSMPDLDGIVTFRTHETRPGRVPSIPRGPRCPHDRKASPAAARRITTAKSLNPGPTNHHPGTLITRHQPRVHTVVHPSGLPLTCGPRMEQGTLGLLAELHTPLLPAAHVGTGTGTRHYPSYVTTTGPPIDATTHRVRPRVARLSKSLPSTEWPISVLPHPPPTPDSEIQK